MMMFHHISTEQLESSRTSTCLLLGPHALLTLPSQFLSVETLKTLVQRRRNSVVRQRRVSDNPQHLRKRLTCLADDDKSFSAPSVKCPLLVRAVCNKSTVQIIHDFLFRLPLFCVGKSLQWRDPMFKEP
jgi:hypothetical protein